jgi:uncharacterized protein DUF5313
VLPQSTWGNASSRAGPHGIHPAGVQAYRLGVGTQDGRRPNPVQWVWYALGGGLPRRLSPWVLADTTARTWVWRHLARAFVQVLPLMVVCLLVPVPVAYRVTAAVGGLFLGLIFSVAFMTETTEHRVAKAGYPTGTAARLREERSERARTDRHSPYRQGGAGSFD